MTGDVSNDGENDGHNDEGHLRDLRYSILYAADCRGKITNLLGCSTIQSSVYSHAAVAVTALNGGMT